MRDSTPDELRTRHLASSFDLLPVNQTAFTIDTLSEREREKVLFAG